MAEASNSTPPGVFSHRFLWTVAAGVSTLAAAGEPFGAADFRGATVGAWHPAPVPS